MKPGEAMAAVGEVSGEQAIPQSLSLKGHHNLGWMEHNQVPQLGGTQVFPPRKHLKYTATAPLLLLPLGRHSL